MTLTVKHTAQFKKDVKRYKRYKYKIKLLLETIDKLRNEEELDIRYKDHPLKGKMTGYRECHIEPDYLLIYQIKNELLYLTRVGSHSELFK